jgi:hypothetical protein
LRTISNAPVVTRCRASTNATCAVPQASPNMTLARAARLIALLTVAVVVGLGMGAAVLLGISAVLPPFRREDGDTLREFIPVALAYAAWGTTTLVILLAGWRRIRACE